MPALSRPDLSTGLTEVRADDLERATAVAANHLREGGYVQLQGLESFAEALRFLLEHSEALADLLEAGSLTLLDGVQSLRD